MNWYDFLATTMIFQTCLPNKENQRLEWSEMILIIKVMLISLWNIVLFSYIPTVSLSGWAFIHSL